MSLRIRSLLVGLVAAVSLGAVVSSASAVVLTQKTVTPSGAYTLSSTSRSFLTILTTGQVLTCTSSRISGTVTSAGVVSIPAGNAIYTGCSNALLGAFTVTQVSAWSGIVGSVASGSTRLVGLEVNVPSNSVVITSPVCSFGVNGTVVLSAGSSFSTTAVAPITTTTAINVLSLVGGGLAVENSTCSVLIASNGARSSYTGGYAISRNATVGI